jgi:hypothetical protein
MSDSLPIAYRAHWERAGNIAMCQSVVIAVALSANEFAGFCAGYLGEGEFVYEPFHAQFRGEHAIHLVLGDRSVLSARQLPFERWPLPVRQAAVRAREALKRITARDAEDFLIATGGELARICWEPSDEGSSHDGVLDDRVWVRIPSLLSLAAQ